MTSAFTTDEEAANRSARGSVKVLYIGGEGRSGSTVLSAILGNYPGFFPVGEIRGLWQALRTDELCACGHPFRECEFWEAVGKHAFGGWDRIDLTKMLAFDSNFARHRNLARTLFPRLQPNGQAQIEDYIEVLSAIYGSVSHVSGSSVIVDSTKDPPYAFLLRRISEIDLRVVHLVRDSRGVAYSWSKQRVERPEYAHLPTLRSTFMNRRAPWRTAVEWDTKNALFHLLEGMGVPRMLVRYEKLMSGGDTSLKEIVGFAHCEETVVDDRRLSEPLREFESRSHHMIGGNRVRFERGVLSIQTDNEWRTAMGTSQRAAVSALTLPLLMLYGYWPLRGDYR